MSHKPTSVSVLQEGMAYTIRLKDGRKIDNAVYYACIASGKPYFGKGDDVSPDAAAEHLGVECRSRDDFDHLACVVRDDYAVGIGFFPIIVGDIVPDE